MIISFKCKEAEKIWRGHISCKLPRDIQEIALIKLRLIEASMKIEDLRIPPSNRLESLKGKRKGQHSIRINQQWRICFEWKDTNAMIVEIIDYH